MSGKKVLCFGELLLRMSPQANGKWLQSNSIPVYVGGAELNVASALARWDIPAKYFTVLPDNFLSKDLLDYLKKRDVDVSSIKFSGNKIGVYYLSQGSDLKHAEVIYDRAHSSFYELKPGIINWEEVLKGVSWLHLSAINPALNENIAEVCLELLKHASQKEITISLDLNFRSKLWKYGKKPVDIMPQIAEYCDLIMGNIWAAEELLGINVDPEILQDRNKECCIKHALYTSRAIQKKIPRAKIVANTFRFDRPDNTVNYYATLYHEGQLLISNEIKACNIIDKIGSGDCFMAGLIYGFYNGMKREEIINFSAASAVGKMYEKSDATDQTVQNIILSATQNIWT